MTEENDPKKLPLFDLAKVDAEVAAAAKARQRAAAKRKGEGKAAPAAKLSHVQKRLVEAAAAPPTEPDLCFQHTVFCQTSLPYRDPGDDVRRWEREQGAVSLLMVAGEAKNPVTGKWVPVGLPWGPKPRLILSHLNAEALRQESPSIEIEGSLSAFVKRVRGFNHGREIRAFKDQLGRLSNTSISLALTREDGGVKQVNTRVVSGFELWGAANDERQKTIWPTTITLSLDYYASLQKHAVPLPEYAIAALAHSAMALDVYAWLAQRLHRIDQFRPCHVSWEALKEQFGQGYRNITDFRKEFRNALKQVLTQYPAARIEDDTAGLWLRCSPTPISRRLLRCGAPRIAPVRK